MPNLPESDLLRIRRYCETRVPTQHQDQDRIECRVRAAP